MPSAPGLVEQLVRAQPSGWVLSMHLVRLPSGGLLVHSPLWLGEDTFERVERVGRPEILFAPNHFHHLSLRRFRERYPEAVAVASPEAIPRLTKQGHAPLQSIDTVAERLPPKAHWLMPEGTKAGEAFLSLDAPSGRSWLVCDAFFNVERPVIGLTGFALRRLGVIPGLRVSRTFGLLALRDAGVYRRWILEALARERPTTLWVSHGRPASAPDLADRLAQLIQKRFRG